MSLKGYFNPFVEKLNRMASNYPVELLFSFFPIMIEIIIERLSVKQIKASDATTGISYKSAISIFTPTNMRMMDNP